MRGRKLWLASTLAAALALVAVAVAEPQDRREGPGGRGGEPGGKFKGGKGGKGGGFAGGLGTDQIVDRLLALDKNKDGKLTKDELPERMADLITRGDGNNDSALDKDEIRKLAGTLAQQGPFGGFQGQFGKGKGKGKGGFPPDKGKGGFPPDKGGFPFGKGGPGAAELRALDELNLSGPTKEKAEAVVKTHQENVRKLMDLARSDLLLKMKDVLSDQDFKTFKEALDRPPGPAFAAPRPAADLERRLDQLQKELEELRRKVSR